MSHAENQYFFHSLEEGITRKMDVQGMSKHDLYRPIPPHPMGIQVSVIQQSTQVGFSVGVLSCVLALQVKGRLRHKAKIN